MRLDQLADFNPPVNLKRGDILPFIEMAALPTNNRYVARIGKKEFTGSGARFENGDTLFARITPCLENGKGAFVSGLGEGIGGFGSTEFIVLRAKEKSDTNFVYYLTRQPEFRRYAEGRMSGSSGRQRVSWDALAEYKLDDLGKGKRQAIGDLLAALDDKIELNRRMNESLEAMTRAIFKSWFVDFDPVRAKMEGRPAGLASEVAALFPERLNDGGLPEGWDRVELGEQFDLSPRTPLSEGGELPYVDMAALPTNSARVTLIAERSPTSGARFTNGDALLARITPCLENGKAAYVDFLDHRQVGIGSTEFIVFRPKGSLTGIWAYLLMRGEDFRNHAIANMSGTSGRQRVSSEALAPWSINLPPMPVTEAFDAITAPIFLSLKVRDDASGTLAALRDLLLPKLMSGEVRIKDAEKLVGEAGA